MPVTFGVTLISPSGSIVESLDVEMKGEFKSINTAAGAFSEARTYDTSYTVSVKGKGDTCPYAAGDNVAGLTGITGTGFWTSETIDSKNDDFRGWSASGTVYKNAS